MLAACIAAALALGVPSTEELLRTFFPQSSLVTYERLDVAESGAARRLGYRPGKESYVIFVAKSGDRVDGYAVIDDELGQHEPITAAVRFDARGVVTGVEVLAYREAYGGEVREQRFQRQLVGRDAEHLAKLGAGVDAVSGATISSRSMVRLVNRAIVLVDILRAEQRR